MELRTFWGPNTTILVGIFDLNFKTKNGFVTRFPQGFPSTHGRSLEGGWVGIKQNRFDSANAFGDAGTDKQKVRCSC